MIYSIYALIVGISVMNEGCTDKRRQYFEDFRDTMKTVLLRKDPVFKEPAKPFVLEKMFVTYPVANSESDEDTCADNDSEEKDLTSGQADMVPEDTYESVMEELNSLIGLISIKAE